MKFSVIAIAAALAMSTAAHAQAPTAGDASDKASETDGKSKPNTLSEGTNARGTDGDSAAKDGQWSGSCEQQSKSGAPTSTDGTTDGSGSNPNNC